MLGIVIKKGIQPLFQYSLIPYYSLNPNIIATQPLIISESAFFWQKPEL